MSWQIKSKDGVVRAIAESVEFNDNWMEECCVTLSIESPTPIDFQIGDYLIYRDERFEINYDPGKIKTAPPFYKGDSFKYDNIKFNSLADELNNCDFLDIVLEDNQLHFTGLPKFTFYGTVQDLADRMQANLDRAYGKNKWSVIVSHEYEGTEELNISIDNKKVSGGLEILVNDFKTYYTIKGRTVTIGAAGVPADHLFQWGKNKGLYEIEENAEQDQQIVTRLRAYGSTRNLPHRYYNSLAGADGVKLIPDNMAVQYLMLPDFPYTTRDPYLDSENIGALGVREGTIFFDGSGELEEIFPSIEGMTAEQLRSAGVKTTSMGALDVLVAAEQITDNGVGEVDGSETKPANGKNTFKVTIKDIGFDINGYLTTETAAVSFKSSKLQGREFEIVDCQKVTNGYTLELNRVYDDGIQLWFPYKDYNAKADDKFVLLHIKMPEVYIKAASQRLKEAALEWLSKNDYSRSVYAPKIDENFMARQHDTAMASGGTIKSLHDTLRAGMQLVFEDSDLGIDAAIFIDSLTIKEGDSHIPKYKVTLKEEKTVGTLQRIQNQIDSLSAGRGQGGGGYTAAQIRSLINAYGGQIFLSKLKDDRSAGQIASDKGFEAGDYLAGVSGAKLGIDAQTGQSFGEMDRLFVRIKGYFESLSIIESATLAGKQYITPGSSVKITSVEEINGEDGDVSTYRCYFLSEQDGEKTETKIIAGDQAIYEIFNAASGSRRYWRLVTAVDNDAITDDSGNHYGYIDLSATDCENGSGEPMAGDTLNQLGNRNDKTRQSAMIFSTVDADSPCIKLFSGIGGGETNTEHYTLSSRDIIAYGCDPISGYAYFRCYGNNYFGSRDGSTFIRYDAEGNKFELHNVALSVDSTIGDKTLEELVADVEGADYLRKALPQSTQIEGGLVMTTMLSLGYVENDMRYTLAGMNGGWDAELGSRTIASWWGGEPIDLYDRFGVKITPTPANAASSLVRMDGSFYFCNGNIGGRPDGSGWLAGDNIRWDSNGSMTFGSGIKINIGTGKEGLVDTINSLLNFTQTLSTLLVPCDENNNELPWAQAVQSNGAGGIRAKSLKAKLGLWSPKYLSALGRNPSAGEIVSGGGGSGATTLGGLENVASEADMVQLSAKILVREASASGWSLKNLSDVVGLDTTALGNYLTVQGYAKKSDIPSLSGYATEQWVLGKGYLTQSALGNYYTKSEVDAMALGGEVDLSGYATQSWVNTQGFLKQHQSLDNYVTLNTAQTISGVKTFSGGIVIPLLDGFFLSMATRTNQIYGGQTSSVSAHSLYTMKNASGSAVSFGGINKTIGFYGFFNSRLESGENGYDWSTTWNADTGELTHSGTFTAGTIKRSGGTASQILMADGSVQTFWKSADVTTATSDNGTITPLAMNSWVTANFVKKSGDTMTGALAVPSISVTSTELVSNLNADMLDGLHSTDYARNLKNVTINANDYDSLKGLWGGKVSNATNAPFAYYAFLHFGWNEYYAQFNAHGNSLRFRASKEGDYTPEWRTVAFVDSNVASANKLAATCKLWGQDFEGNNNVSGNMTGVGSISHSAGIVPTTNNAVRLGSADYNYQGVHSRQFINNTDTLMVLWQAKNYAMYFATNGVERMRIMGDGKVGIGTQSPTVALDVVGAVHSSVGFHTEGYVTALKQSTSSDARLKEIVGEAALPIDVLAAAPSVMFRWKQGAYAGQMAVGTIAQYWQEWLPSVVSKQPDGYLALDYGTTAMVGVINLARYTKSEIELAKEEIERLKSRIVELEKRIA